MRRPLQPIGALEKAPSGIRGFDEITDGGLPRGRTTLLTGSAGCGKTLFGVEFLVHGAREFHEPGVFMAFEETARDLETNAHSLGLDLAPLLLRNELAIDHVRVERSEIEETGAYDLDGLFVRLGHAIDSIGAKRVVLDTLEVLFAGLGDTGTLRAELRRLFRWLGEKGVTTIVTAERGDGTLTRHGLEEYVSDCVILLDHRVHEQVTTRRLRVIKYRGSRHGTNEYPFLIGDDGIAVLPITSLGLNHAAPVERISTGVPGLDAMLDGQGFYRGSTVLVSGAAGAGKSSLTAAFASAACARCERVLYIAMEESPAQILRNMRSIGLDLERWTKRDLLSIHAMRPSVYGLEMHLMVVHRLLERMAPAVVVIDPITNLGTVGTAAEVKLALTRLIDELKRRGITAMLTSLTAAGHSNSELSEVQISSLIDAWVLLTNLEANGERNRGLYVLKARGLAHSNQIREFKLTSRGLQLIDPYLGPDGVLTGTARIAREAAERATQLEREREIERKRRERTRRRAVLEAEVAALRARFAAEARELLREIDQGVQTEVALHAERTAMAKARYAEPVRRGKVLKHRSARTNGRARD